MSCNINLYSMLYFSFSISHLLSARKSKLQKQEEEEHQQSRQVTRAPLFLDKK
jgi:hypothetical protein